jgi:hypothetical protein
MAAGFSKVNFAAFEQIVSSDINRLQRLANRDIQDLLKSASRPDAFRNTGGGFVGPSSILFGAGSPIDAVSAVPNLVSASGLTMQLGAGQAFLQLASGITADDSAYQVQRWDTQIVTFGAADPTNPRVDIVVAELAEVGTDPLARNVLVNPTTRTVVSQIINKTSNPKSTISVITGTAAASPVPPLEGSSSRIILFEVWVPALAASSASFVVIPRAWQRMSYPLNAVSGALTGCIPVWTLVDEATTSSDINLSSSVLHRAIVDGEVLTFKGTVPNASDDTVSPPGSAPAGNDKPFYIYLCGGRRNPRRSAAGCPFVLVMSLTAPDEFGHPAANLGDATGTIDRGGAVYVGVGFVVFNSSRRKPCRVVGDFVYAMSSTGVNIPMSFTDEDRGPNQTFDINTKPASSTLARLVVLNKTGPTGAGTFNLQLDNGPDDSGLIRVNHSATNGFQQIIDVPLDGLPATPFKTDTDAGFGATDIAMRAVAYNMNVPRLMLGDLP